MSTFSSSPTEGDRPVAMVTGAARGVGRACAVRMARSGHDVILIDRCADESTTAYSMASASDLSATAHAVADEGRAAIEVVADVRDQDTMEAAVRDGVARFGRLDAVVCSAGISSFGPAWELSDDSWSAALDVMLSGAWRTAKAAIPALLDAGGSSITMIGSAVGTKASVGAAHYVSAKHGLVGLARALALELAPHFVRVNVVAPGSVQTDMALNEAIRRRYRPDLESPSEEDVVEGMRARHALPVPWVDPRDVANAVNWLASDEARFITGAVLPVDAGWTIK